MTHFEHYRSGALFGIRYLFEHAGDEIPEHAHDERLAHNIVVMGGAVTLVVAGKEPRTLIAGDICDFKWSAPHRIFAVRPMSQTLHLFLNGMPAGYDTLPEHERKGFF